MRVLNEPLADHVGENQSHRAVQSAEERLVVGDAVDFRFGGENDGVRDDIGDVGLVIEANEFWDKQREKRLTCRGRKLDGIRKIEQRKRKEMVREARGNN